VLGPTDPHDPHESAGRQVGADHPSDTTIEAYLIRLDHRSMPDPAAVIELSYPGDETAVYLLTFSQLRRLEDALAQLRHLEDSRPPAPNRRDILTHRVWRCAWRRPTGSTPGAQRGIAR
jgi:hypothetical protein